MREIGDFEAHSDKRTKGLVTDHFKNFFAKLRFSYPYEYGILDLWEPNKFFERAMDFTIEVIPDSDLEQISGMKSGRARKALKRALRNYKRTDHGFEAIDDHTTDDAVILNALSRYILVYSILDQESLMEDLSLALQKERLISSAESNLIKQKSELIFLYVAALMHNSGTLSLEYDDEAELAIGVDHNNFLLVCANTQLSAYGRPTINQAAPLIGSFLSSEIYLGGDLLDQISGNRLEAADLIAFRTDRPGMEPINNEVHGTYYQIRCPVELRSDGKLYKL